MPDEPTENASSVSTSDPGVILRSELAQHFGNQYQGDRDIYDTLGYPEEVTAHAYRAKYRRNDMAKRIIELPPESTWQDPPEVTDADSDDGADADADTAFTDAIETLDRDRRLWHYCKRADIAAGIGEYGLLFIGFADGQPLDEPVNAGALAGDPAEDVAFLTPFGQDAVEDWLLGKEKDDAGIDATDRMYNRPVEYTIDFSDLDGDPNDNDFKEVHHSRVIHIAEDLVESDLKGQPRLRAVYNRLLDMEKVVGASAEMFWTGADRKFQFNIDTDNVADIPASKLEQMDDEVQKMVHGMQHYVKTFNTDMQTLDGSDPDPSAVLDELIKFISGATGIPQRILTGSERGELASSQDRANWADRIDTRQETFAGPAIVRPLIDRLVEFGVLPEPSGGEYDVAWPEMFDLTEIERADVMRTRADAMQTLAPGNNTDMIAPLDALYEFVVNGEEIDFEEFEDAIVGPEEAAEEAEVPEEMEQQPPPDQAPPGQGEQPPGEGEEEEEPPAGNVDGRAIDRETWHRLFSEGEGDD